MFNINTPSYIELLKTREFRKFVSIKSLIAFLALAVVCFLFSILAISTDYSVILPESANTFAQITVPMLMLALGFTMLKSIDVRLYIANVNLCESRFIRGN